MKRKKVGEVSWTPIILVGALVGGVIWIFKNGIPNPLASAANAGNNADVSASTATSADSTLQILQSQGQNPTISAATASAIATDVYNEGLDGSQSAQDTIVSDMIKVFNDADYLLVMKAFGTKQAAASMWSTCGLLGFDCQPYDLTSWLKAVLDYDHQSTINEYYRASYMTMTL